MTVLSAHIRTLRAVAKACAVQGNEAPNTSPDATIMLNLSIALYEAANELEAEEAELLASVERKPGQPVYDPRGKRPK